MQTLLMNRATYFPSFETDPVAIQSVLFVRRVIFLSFRADFVEPHGRLVLRIIHHFRIIFLALQFLFIKRRILLRAEKNRVFINQSTRRGARASSVKRTTARRRAD